MDALLELIFGSLPASKEQRSFFMRASWFVVVSLHILWIWGLLAWAGFAAPFARASTVEELAKNASITARLQLTQEMRVQTLYWCALKDQTQQSAVERILDRLHEEYRRVTNGEKPPEFKCGEP